MSESTEYEGHWPPRPVKSVKEGQTFQFPDPRTGCILTGTVVTTPRIAALMRLEDGEYTWAWVHELSEKENMSESENVEPHNPWRELWVEWFDFDREPWEEDYLRDELRFFCWGSRDSRFLDCVYLKAKRLLDKEAE